MAYIIGIDIGGSTTKIVGLQDGSLAGACSVRASDPVTSAYGAFGKFLTDWHLNLTSVDKVMFTGVGSSFLQGQQIYGIPTRKVDEFRAIGLGGRYISGLEKCIVVSMGTGTAITSVSDGEIHHVCGTGVGGGTILGLGERLCASHSFSHLLELAKSGDLGNVDLAVGDITHDQLSNMQNKTTASNFGKISDNAGASDLALGLLNMVFQTVGTFAMMAARPRGMRDIVLTGTLACMDLARPILNELEELYDVRYLVPEHADFATAIGAAILGEQER